MYSQSPYVCRVEWGLRGAREAAERGDITIIVDVLSFSSTVVAALHFGAVIFPHPPARNGQAEQFAKKRKATLVAGRKEAAESGGPSLSPVSFGPRDKGRKYVLCSLNGAACSTAAAKSAALLVGSLLNASAVADAAERIRARTGADITVVPCGEQWADAREGENRLRPGIEDYLGAGAILSRLRGSLSPEARVCTGAFRAVRDSLAELIWDCASGRELRLRGFAEDVRFCARLDVFGEVPLLQGDRFVDASRAWKTDGDPTGESPLPLS